MLIVEAARSCPPVYRAKQYAELAYSYIEVELRVKLLYRQRELTP